jgi:drug/metabolite transporter (DMT)-like permease
MFLVILLYALLALTFTLGKLAVAYANPLFLIAVRMIVGGGLLLAFYMLKHRTFYLAPRDRATFISLTVFHIYLSFVPEFWALQFISSIKVNIMYATTPFIAMIFSYFLYKERVTRYQLAGALCAFIGLLPLLIKGEEATLTDWRTLLAVSMPELALFVSIVSGAYAWFIIKRLMNRGYSLSIINGVAMFAGGILSLLTWLLVRRPEVSPIVALKPFLLTVGGLIILSNLVVYNLYGWLLHFYSVNLVACVGFLSPLFGAFYGHIFLGESLGWQHGVAIVSIAIGLYLFFYKELLSSASRKDWQSKLLPSSHKHVQNGIMLSSSKISQDGVLSSSPDKTLPASRMDWTGQTIQAPPDETIPCERDKFYGT